MKTPTFIITILLLLTACGSVKTKSPALPESQDQLLLATLWYQKSAEMRAMYYQCYTNAKTALVKNLAVSEGKKVPAVVLDIDETVLDNSPFQSWQIIENKVFNNQDWVRWVELAMAAPLPGAVDFTRFADSLGVEVYYISNRSTAELSPTLENMSRFGFPDADSSHILLKGSVSSKVERRAQVEKDCEILLLIGDNLADLSAIYEKREEDLGFGAVETDRKLFGTRYIVLPNPMYGNWLSEIVRRNQGMTTREGMLKMLESF